MSFFENVLLALAGIKANKMRAALTMLGIIIGISAVIGISTIGNSLATSITSSMQDMGANNLTISLQQKSKDGTTQGDFMTEVAKDTTIKIPQESDTITDEMIDGLTAMYPNEIEYVSLSENVGTGEAKNGRLYANITTTGVNSDYAAANNLKLQKGRFIRERDVEGVRDVAVVSDNFAQNMFGESEPLGQEVKININNSSKTYTIVGVYEYMQSALAMMGSTVAEKDISTDFYIPITTAKKVSGSGNGYQYLTIVTKTGTQTDFFVEAVQKYFDKYYTRNENFGVNVNSMESLVSELSAMTKSVSLAISIIAAISLLVGGIGVMNIMLVSITERTREIGTRKALGAKNSSIRMQFIVESMIICLIGGAIGTIFGIILGIAGAALLGYPASPDAATILLAAGISIFIGVFFGYYPANKAAKMNPIEALRYE
ncbi:MAG: ABC transporter permease [Christensenellaceae bacterium]